MDRNDFTPKDMDIFTHSIAGVIERQKDAYEAISQLVDATGQSWFELGEKLERKRILNVIDTLESKLVDSEEDAKMTLAVLRELIENGEEEDDGDVAGE
jgi:hypothetical protein